MDMQIKHPNPHRSFFKEELKTLEVGTGVGLRG
jgi:hypothetical protein